VTPGEFYERVLAYCSWSRASVTSGLRSPERNAAVHGHERSMHLVGLAADVVYHPNPVPGIDTAKHFASRLGLLLVRESDHDHIQVPY